MLDLSKGFTFYAEQDDHTGKWSVSCPACKAIVRALTEGGLDIALCAHMNERHFLPARGNA